MNSIDLKIDWCSFHAAKYAVENWHYSKSMPVGKLLKFGVWENSVYIGAIVFGRGSCLNIGRPFDLKQDQVCELLRVALNSHKTSVTKIISICLKQIKEKFTKIQLIISFADTGKNHLGIIYQAGNWIYMGTGGTRKLIINGKKYHTRTIGSRFGTNSLDFLREKIDKNVRYEDYKAKHKYLMPLNKKIRKQVLKFSKPYPKIILVRDKGIIK